MEKVVERVVERHENVLFVEFKRDRVSAHIEAPILMWPFVLGIVTSVLFFKILFNER